MEQSGFSFMKQEPSASAFSFLNAEVIFSTILLNLQNRVFIFMAIFKYKAPQSNEEVNMLGQVIQEPQGIILEKVAQPKIVRNSLLLL